MKPGEVVSLTIKAAEATPGERVVFAYVPPYWYEEVFEIEDLAEFRETHQRGAEIWLEYNDGKWKVGVYWIDENGSEDPVEFKDFEYLKDYMYDFREFFVEPYRLHMEGE